MTVVSVLAAAIAFAGLAQAAIGYALVRRFRAVAPTAPWPRERVSVLKPLHGAEPRLEEALSSLCRQAGESDQIIFGLQDSNDPARGVAERVRRLFPAADITIVVDPTQHGPNRKVANLINMLPHARHDILVIADSDIHAPAGYLAALVAALQSPNVGLATTLYTGLPSNSSLAARLGATALTHGLLPGALMARALGRQDCLGATMALRRRVLERVGGLAALSPYLADDHVLGELVLAQGLRVALATTVPATTVAESDLAALYRHELRWGRTIGAIVPVRFALSCVQYPLFWAGLGMALGHGAQASVAVFLAVWAGRALISRGIDRELAAGRPGLANPAPIWLLPLRDLLSFSVAVASYLGDEVVWRGHVMRSDRLGRPGPAKRALTASGLNTPGLATRKLGTEPP